MAFTPKDWVDSPSSATPLSAAALEDLETRLSDYTDARAIIATQSANDYTDTAIAENTVISYGADPTGTFSSTDAFQDMIDAGDVVIGAGTYKVGLVTYEGSASRTIRALPGHRVVINQTNINGVFSLRGGWDELGSISSIASGNVDGNDDGTSNTYVSLLTMSGSTSITKGDILKVVSDNPPVGYDPAGTGTIVRRGEYSMAAATSSGTTVSLGNQLVDSYSTSPRLARLWDTRFVVEGDITFNGSTLTATTGYTAAIEMRAAKYCVIDGIVFTDIPGRAIANYTYAADIRNCRFKNLSNRPSLSHYGYGLNDGGHMTRMHNCHGENLRHMYSENPHSVSAGSTSYEYFGGGWFGKVSDCTASNCQAAPFDTHETAYGTTFSGCKAFGTFIGASSGGNGFTARGRRITFDNCEANNCHIGFNIGVWDGCLLQDCKSFGSTQLSILSGCATTADSSITGQTNVRVKGGVFEGARNTTTKVCELGNTSMPSDIHFQGTEFRMIGSAGAGSTIFDCYGAASVRGDECFFDLSQWGGGTAALQLMLLRNTTAVRLTMNNLRILSVADASPVLFAASTGSTATPIRIYDYQYEYIGANSRSLTIGHANTTDYKTSGSQRFGTAWYQKTLSSSIGITAASSGSLAAVGLVLDDHCYVRLTGSAGSVTMAALPNAEFQGQAVTFINKSNGIVTINSTAIAVDGSATFTWGPGAATWYVANNY